jgi:hypothetical protein
VDLERGWSAAWVWFCERWDPGIRPENGEPVAPEFWSDVFCEFVEQAVHHHPFQGLPLGPPRQG